MSEALCAGELYAALKSVWLSYTWIPELSFKLTFIKDVLPALQKKSKTKKIQVTARFRNRVEVPELSSKSVSTVPEGS